MLHRDPVRVRLQDQHRVYSTQNLPGTLTVSSLDINTRDSEVRGDGQAIRRTSHS